MRRKARFFLFLLTLMLLIVPTMPALADSGSNTTLQVGSRGDQVSELQRLLQEAGFFPAAQKVTGYYGWVTYGAVTALEKKNGLPVNGRVDGQEWNILYGRKQSSRVVLGYYTVDYPGDRLSYNSLANSGQLVNQVAMFDFGIDYRGNLKGSVSWEGLNLARKKGVRTLMVVHNFSNGTFDRQSAITALKSYRSNLVDNIVKQVVNNGYDGVNIDLEGIPSTSRGDFNAFLEKLGSSLKAKSKLLTLAVPAKTGDDPKNSWSGGYDYKTIGRLADYVVIMSYDEHWGGGPPGPVASVPWVTRVLNYSVTAIPPEKILMGVACYGYDWPDKQKGKAIKWKDIPGLTAQYGPVRWDNNFSVPYLVYYKNGISHQVWFENSYSLAIKLNLVDKYGLGGIAFWRMGFEDSSFQATLEKKMGK